MVCIDECYSEQQIDTVDTTTNGVSRDQGEFNQDKASRFYFDSINEDSEHFYKVTISKALDYNANVSETEVILADSISVLEID